MSPATILVVGREHVDGGWPERLRNEGYAVRHAATDHEAADVVQEVDVAVINENRAYDDLALLKRIKALTEDMPVILVTGGKSVDKAVAAMKAGAFHCAAKPLDVNEAVTIVERALESTRLRGDLQQLRTDAARPYGLHRIIGNSPTMAALRHLVARVALTPAATVLMTGESGTGKDLLAKVIHYASDRSAKPFMNITCSALPEQLLESELFGHERGAFTDAHAQKKGLLEQAHGGTLFLDEIGEMTPALQTKLLRFLEEKSFKRIGSASDIKVDVRVIAATNRDLEHGVENHAFRADLFFRLNVLRIEVPPLRTHPEDIPLLVDYFIDTFDTEFRKHVKGATPEAYAVLQAYRWPGNVRELRNLVERAMLLSESTRLEAEDFNLSVTDPFISAFELPIAGVKLEEVERSLVAQALQRSKGNRTRAAGLLGLNRDQIRYRIEKFGLAPAVAAQ